MRVACLVTWLGCLGATALAQRSPLPPERWEKVRSTVNAVYRLDYETAAAGCREMISRWPDDPAGYVYLARVYWQQLLFTERALTVQRFSRPDYFSEVPRYKVRLDPAAEQRFRAASDEAIGKARLFAQNKPTDPGALYLLGAAYQNEASFQISVNNAWYAGVRAGDQSYRAHRQLLAQDAKYSDARLVTGVYNYTVGSLPWKVRWLALLLGYHGSKEQGVADLETAAAKGEIAADDARTMLVLVHAIERRYDRALAKLEELRQKYPENYLTHLDMAALEILRGRPAAAVGLYQQALAKIEAGTGSYVRLESAIVHNQLGVAYRAMKDYPEAEQWLRRSINSASTSPGTKVLALLELGKTLDLAGRRQQAVVQYRQVVEAQDYAGSRAEASQYLSRSYQGK